MKIRRLGTPVTPAQGAMSTQGGAAFVRHVTARHKEALTDGKLLASSDLFHHLDCPNYCRSEYAWRLPDDRFLAYQVITRARDADDPMRRAEDA